MLLIDGPLYTTDSTHVFFRASVFEEIQNFHFLTGAKGWLQLPWRCPWKSSSSSSFILMMMMMMFLLLVSSQKLPNTNRIFKSHAPEIWRSDWKSVRIVPLWSSRRVEVSHEDTYRERILTERLFRVVILGTYPIDFWSEYIFSISTMPKLAWQAHLWSSSR